MSQRGPRGRGWWERDRKMQRGQKDRQGHRARDRAGEGEKQGGRHSDTQGQGELDKAREDEQQGTAELGRAGTVVGTLRGRDKGRRASGVPSAY